MRLHHKFLFLLGILISLAGCIQEDNLPGPDTSSTVVVNGQQTGESPPVAVSIEPTLPNSSTGVLEAVLIENANDPALAASTLYQMMSVPVPGGESIVYHYNDSLGGVVIACTGHAHVIAVAGGSYDLGGTALACGPVENSAAMSLYPSQGIDQTGQQIGVVYGELYDDTIVAIRVYYQGGQTAAVISNGAYQAWLPAGATGVSLIAFNAEGHTVFESSTLPD